MSGCVCQCWAILIHHSISVCSVLIGRQSVWLFCLCLPLSGFLDRFDRLDRSLCLPNLVTQCHTIQPLSSSLHGKINETHFSPKYSLPPFSIPQCSLLIFSMYI